MNILQVKDYHNNIASIKEQKALERWRASNNGYGYPVKSMFYFMLEDNKGYPTELRQRGYVAFNERCACYGSNEEKAIEKFNERGIK